MAEPLRLLHRHRRLNLQFPRWLATRIGYRFASFRRGIEAVDAQSNPDVEPGAAGRIGGAKTGRVRFRFQLGSYGREAPPHTALPEL